MSTESVDLRLANEAWESVMTAHARLTAVFAAEDMWSEAGMREYDVLYTLAKGDGPMRLCQIQDGVLLSQPALSRMIDRLVARGLLHRETDPDDGRAVRISLTEEGVRVQRETGRAHARSVGRELGAALSPDEMRTLRELCRKLASA
ncbi:MarR family winged helix-turn-helix transcriptional regulator [Leucobacter sp. wl10]|uniref:MarR family winged helix-turn-helix transcriptional regulator n=1 Tax=Leucobacter sp. wl10 TaxID=2304677 RepID=UPI000E5BE874|nr:MarR family transcriptional regulator [Leucobacter sp. wl10]RGE23234.1 MarR family transcriptional regulator [Leucobacter sp. wl10]